MLSRTTGLHFYDSQLKPTALRIEVKNALQFGQFDNTLIVIQKSQILEEILELFVDYREMNYYLNSIYIEDTYFKHIHMIADYAIIISEDEHLIL